MDLYEKIRQAIVGADEGALLSAIDSAMEKGASPINILNEGLVAGMGRVSEACDSKHIFIPEMLKISDVYTAGYNKILSLIDITYSETVGKVVVGCIKDELHDFGKNLLVLALRLRGFEVIDFGIDAYDEAMIDTCIREKADFVCLNITMPGKRMSMKEHVDRFLASGLGDRLIIGGAGMDPEFADTCRSIFYEESPYAAADRMYEMVTESRREALGD